MFSLGEDPKGTLVEWFLVISVSLTLLRVVIEDIVDLVKSVRAKLKK